MPVNSFENYPMSWKPSKNYDGKPIYISLAEQLEKDIEWGLLLPGTKLPPQRELADYLDINVSTISRAFKLCEKKGILVGMIGSGTFVSYDVRTKLNVMPEMYSENIIEMGSVMPEIYPQSELNLLLKKMLSEHENGELFQYSYGAMSIWHSQAMLRFVKKCRYNANLDNLLISNGGQNALAAILTGIFKAGDKIGTDPLTYPGFKTLAKMLGIQLVPIKQIDGEMSIEGIEYAYRNEGIKAIYVMPDFHNPTTKLMSEKKRIDIAEFAIENNILVIEDSINTLLMRNIIYPIANYAPENTIYIASFSKAVIPALRLACIITPQKLYNNLKTSLYNLNLSQSNFILEIAARIVESDCMDKIISKRRERIIKRNSIVNHFLKDYDVIGTEECIFRWIVLPEGIDGNEFERIAIENGVQVYAAERFFVGVERPISGIRISISSPKDERELIAGLKIIKKTIETWV